jgi:hypothetical protein
MGLDPTAVVDERLRVHGIDGLRVIDGSIMPTVVSGNMGIPACLRRCRPRFRLYRPTGTGLPWLCRASAARRGGGSAACCAPVKMIGLAGGRRRECGD